MKWLIGTLALSLFVLATATFASRAADEKKEKPDAKKGDQRVFELRTYHAAPGKMKALETRFRDHTNKLFEKHGITIIGFWTDMNPKEGEEKLIYIVAYPSKEAADKSWKEFRDDADWKKAFAESEKDGKLVNKVDSVYMNPTDFSPIK